MPKGSYTLISPEKQTTSVVFASPHSGRDYPREFLAASILDELAIRSSEDAYVDHLFAPATEHGAPLLVAEVPRAYVDLNRSADEFDPAVIDGARRGSHNPRIASGLGVIPRVVSNGRAIYHGKITLADARRRIETSWRPYHGALQTQLDRTLRQFGEAVLIDCHSMPHEAVDSIARSGARRPDVVIGDRFGASATPEVVDRIEAAFRDAGLHVIRNAPFAGAFVTQHYGRPSRGVHAVQIEIDRALYLDEANIVPGPDYEDFRALLGGVIRDLAAIGRRRAVPLAAE